MQISGKRGFDGDTVAGSRHSDRDRIRNRAIPGRCETIERFAWPGRARRLDEGAALRSCFEVALLRGYESGGKFRDGTQSICIIGCRGTVRVREQDGIAKHAPAFDEDRKPPLKAAGIGDVALLDRPFDAARIRERPDRIGGREPRHVAGRRNTRAAEWAQIDAQVERRRYLQRPPKLREAVEPVGAILRAHDACAPSK